MASSRSLGSLTIDLIAKVAGFTAGLTAAEREADKRSKAIASKLKGAFAALGGAALVAEMTSAARAAIDLGDEINKAATKAGIGGRAMSELAHAAAMSDVDLGGLSDSLRKLQVNLSEAATGGKAQQQTLRALGVELESITGLAADQQFELIADRISQLSDPAERARAAVDLFGKSGANLLPLFEGGARGIRAAREEAERLGKSFSDEQIKALSEADDAVKRLTASWDGFATKITAKVAPALTATLELLSGSSGKSNLSDAQRDILDQIDRLSGVRNYYAGSFGEEAAAKAREVSGQIQVLQGELKRLQGGGPGPRGGQSVQAPGFGTNTAEEDAERAANDKAFARAEEQFRRQIALWGDVTKAAEIAYETQRGELVKLDDAQKQQLLSMAKQIDQQTLLDQVNQTAGKDIAQAVVELNSWTAGVLRDTEAETTEVIDGELRARVDAERQAADAQVEIDRKLQQQLAESGARGIDNAVAGLDFLAGKHKAVAAAVFLWDKRHDIAQAFIDTRAAVMTTYSKLGYPWGVPAAAAVAALGAANIAAMVSASPGMSGGGGGTGGGGYSEPATSRNTSTDSAVEIGASAQRIVHVNYYGDVYGVEKIKNVIIDALKEYDNIDGVVFSANGRQAQEIRG